MADESTAQAGVEPEVAPEAPAEVTENQADPADQTDDGESEEQGDEQEPEFDEYDFGGNKLKLPKGSVPDELRQEIEKFSKGTWADYTRKSQEVAESRKSVEARESAVAKVSGLNDDLLDTFSYGKQLKKEVEQLSQVNLNALWQSNPDQARRVSDALAQKQAEFQSVVAQVAQKEHTLSQTQAAETARRVDEGKAIIEKQIKGFEAKHLPEVIEYATSKLGIPKEAAIRDWPLNPAITVAVHKAAQFDKLQARAAQAAKPQPAAQQPTPVVPMRGKGTGNAATRDPTKMSMDEYAKWRKAGNG